MVMRKLGIKLNGAIKVAFAEIDYCENVLVKIETDEYITGYGEAAPLAFVTGETADGVLAILEMLKPGLIGRNPLAVDDIHALIDSVAHGNPSAKCAIDLAIYDIRGKVMGKPVYQLLGGNNDIVQNDVTIGIAEPEEMVRLAKHYVEDKGYRILKVKAGIDPAQDVEALTRIRKAVGDGIRLRVDANQGYAAPVAIGVLEKFDALGVDAVEQCLPDWDFEGAAYVRSKAAGSIRLMLDESIHGPHDAMRAVRAGAADIFNIKLMKCGGLYPAEQISAIAAAGGVTCMVGCMLETRLAITAGLSLVAAKANVTEADCDSFLYYDAAQTGVTGGFTVENDLFRLNDEPGFGVQVEF
jgi:L-alanine-DL-glutamate epimerase-like enolase superfamily enzyme